MKITLICPKCKRERKFDNLWWLLFGEERAIFQQQIKEIEKSQWLKERPEKMKELMELKEKANELEKKLMCKDFLELKSLYQRMTFLQNYISYKDTSQLKEK